MDWLRIVVVGHVDHGKSTLIGRLLHESGALPDGRLEEICAGSLGDGLEWAFLLDHLREEREQERTIDATQAFFATPKRVYRIIDAPGHMEFLKNMVTGAAQADAAILVVDVESGVLEQTRRHVAMLAMLGIEHVIVAVNKMDRVRGQREPFEAVSSATDALLGQTHLSSRWTVPISARYGWNLASCPSSLAWDEGPTLFQALDSLEQPKSRANQPLRLPVQDVYERDGRKIIVGRIESGRLELGQAVACLPSRRTVRIRSVERFLETRTSAEAGESIGLTLEEPLDLRRGEVLCDPDAPPPVARRFEANMFWLADREWTSDNLLILRCATQEAPCRIERVHQRIDSSTLEVIETDAGRLEASDVARATLAAEQPIVIEKFALANPLGRFVLLKDRRLCAGGTVTQVLK